MSPLQGQDGASAIAWTWATRTRAVRPHGDGSAVDAPVAPYSSWLQVADRHVGVTTDGIGTKVEVAERQGRFDTLGWDLVAMVVDDLAANGSEPVAVVNCLDVDRIDPARVDELMRGLHDAAVRARVAVVGGEVAELGSRVGGWGPGMHLNWSATAVGVARPGWRPIDGRALQAGDAVVALQCSNFRANGFTALRALLSREFGADWHEAEFAGRRWGDWLLDPCEIYAPAVVAMRAAGLDLRGLAHITGGGIPNKLGRVLRPRGLGADLDALFAPPVAMFEAWHLSAADASLAWSTWNMGNGFLVCLPESEVDAALAVARSDGVVARRAGTVVAAPRISIRQGGHAVSFDLGVG